MAAYASYEHQRDFALHGGADPTSAALWPLSVDGLLLLASVGVLKPRRAAARRMRSAMWMAFLLGIVVSLVANIAAAPNLGWQPVIVAGWPPVALLLSVELLGQYPGSRESAETETGAPKASLGSHGSNETTKTIKRAAVSGEHRVSGGLTAEQIMWNHFQREQARGRTPTGAELDRVAGTNNYGRAVLAGWRRNGRTHPHHGSARDSP